MFTLNRITRSLPLACLFLFIGCRSQEPSPSAPETGTAATRPAAAPRPDAQSQLWFQTVQRGDAAAVSALLDSGTPIETRHPSDGRTALMLAAVQKQLPLVKTLLARGAKVDAKDDDGVTPLMWAAFSGSPGIVKTLTGAGAKTDAKDNFGKTALDWGQNHPEIVGMLKKTKGR